MFTQGYVGVAKQGAEHRYKEHQSKAKNGGKYVIHNAIRKYSDKLILDVIIYADIEYCYEMEGKLRPTGSIGYNISAGGQISGLGSKRTPEMRKRLSNIAKAQGRKPSQEALDNSAKTNSKMVAWLCRFSDKETWQVADTIYEYMTLNPKHGIRKIGTVLNLGHTKLQVISKKIKAGWNPSLDTEWLIFSGKLSPDTSGDKSIETGISPN